MIVQKPSTWLLLVTTLCCQRVWSYKISCDEGWTGFSESTSCYRVMNRVDESFTDAEQICKNYDGNLAIINTVSEKDFIAKWAGELSNKNVWIGLKYDAKEGWKWLDNTDVDSGIIEWANKTDEGCGSLRLDGKLEGLACERPLHYICEQPLGKPKKCGEGWEKYGNSCYKRYHHENRPWDEASHICQDDFADLIVVNSEHENRWLYEFANRDQVDIWLGIVENATLSGDKKYVWIDGTIDGGENVISKWETDQPGEMSGNGRGMMSSNANGKWSTRSFVESLSFVCERPVGDFCVFDLIDVGGDNCYDFYLEFDRVTTLGFDLISTWDVANTTCSQSGMTLLNLMDHDEDNAVTNYLYSTGQFSMVFGRAGVWLGYRETAPDSNHTIRISDQKPIESVYNGLNESPSYHAGELDCLYLLPCPPNSTDCSVAVPDENHRWNADKCFNPVDTHAIGCKIKKGESLDVSGLMHPKEFCPEGWGSPFAGNCYLLVATEVTFGDAQAFCKKNQSSSDVVSILSVYENEHIKQFVAELGNSDIWIGLRDIYTEGNWEWADGAPATFLNWADTEPNGGRNENCAIINVDGWSDYNCGSKKNFVCKTRASTDPSGDPVLPDTSTMPPTSNCGFNGHKWIENPDTGMCYALITESPLGWQDAREHCKEYGGFRENGDLASIGSEEEQAFFNSWFTIVQHFQSTWIGLSDLNRDSAFEWADGTPFAFINWRDSEPNGGNNENCGEINFGESRGEWNDYICTQSLPFVCEKQGDNYVEPPTPVPPKPTCPDGWREALGRCLYYSQAFEDKAHNWTEAKAKCKALGTTLASIRDEADQDEIYYQVQYTSYLGASDAVEEGKWVWEDGTTFAYNHWGDGEPNGGTEENCLEIDYYGIWNDVACGGDQLQPFICATEIKLCPEDWFFFDGMCWRFSPEEGKASWSAAQDICQETSSGHGNLISVHGEREGSILMDAFQDDPWIGLTIISGGSYEWADGSKVDYSPWKEGEPDNIETDTCVSAGHDDGLWSSNNCDQDKPFACNFKSSHFISCPSGWEKWNGNCYLLQPESNLMGFEAAEELCVNHGGHLASVNSAAELDFLQALLAGYGSCGDGWAEDAERQLCYFHDGQKALWPEANETCYKMDARLAIIKDKAKNDKIKAFAPLRSAVMIGLTDYAEEGHWVWIDGTPLDCESEFCDWHSGEPNGLEDQNCVEIWNDPGGWYDPNTWNDGLCDDDLRDFVCEKPFPASKMVKVPIWIGLNDLDNSKTLKWTDESRVAFTKWATGQPNHHVGDNFKCTVINTKNEMQLVECNEEHFSVCKRPTVISTVPPESYGCSENQYAFEGSCYEIHHRHVTFDDAQRKCESDGGNLVSINNMDEQAELVSILAMTFGTFFIGLKYHEETSSFEWVNGESVAFTDGWDHYQPDLNFDDDGKGKCAMVNSNSGFWFVWKCSELKGYICESPRRGYTNPPTTTTTVKPEAICESYDWYKYNDHCYRFFDEPRTFANADEFCRSKGGHLVSFSNYDEELTPLTSAVGYIQKSFWIGLRQDDGGNADGGYYWVDDTPFDYTNWKNGMPESYGGSDNCIILEWYYNTADGWVNHNCESELSFVCEVLAGVEPPTTVPPPTIPPIQNCKEGVDDGWVKGPDDFCYKFSATISQSDTWSTIEYACLQEGAHLASIHSHAENTFVMVNLNRKGITDAFLGLFMNQDDQFEWSDGTTTDYFQWSSGEPNNYFGLEGCGVMYGNNGRWNDAHCSKAANGYVCKIPASGAWTTAKPTQAPTGHCPSDQHEFKGYCYKFMGLSDSAEYKNWTDARRDCRNLGKSYELASVHSDNEQAFLNAILAENDPGNAKAREYEFWIGFKDWNHWGSYDITTFVWSDGSAVDYVNWAAGEPNDNFYTEGLCVEMYAHDDFDIGHWNDLNCEREIGYICRGRASIEIPEPPPVKKCTGSLAEFDKWLDGCYRSSEQSNKLSWTDAEKECMKMEGSHLASILSYSEQSYMLNKVESELAWIGLSDVQRHGYFKWSDGWTMQLSNWGSEPPVDSDVDICVAYNSTDGRWYPRECSEQLPFVCKHSDKTPPTPGPNGECPTHKFIDLDPNFDHCYFIAHGSYTNVAWDSAQQFCMDLAPDTHLASIHSEGEMSKLHGAVGANTAILWIGMYSNIGSPDDYQWVDKSPVDFFNWEESEPNDPREFCVQIYGSNGKWNDASCDSYQTTGYVCKTKKVLIPTSTEGPTKPSTSDGGSSSSDTSTHSTKSTSQGETTTRSTTTRTTTTTTYAATPESYGMSPGGVAALVIVCILVVAGGVVFLVVYFKKELFLRKLRGLRQPQNQAGQMTSFENMAYDSNTGFSSAASS